MIYYLLSNINKNYNMNIKIKNIINDNFKKCYQNQIQYLQTNNVTTDTKELQTLQNFIDSIDTIKHVEHIEEQETFFDDINNYMFTKDWDKLTSIHKIMKINEYFKYMAETEYKDYIMNKLTKLINDKKLNNNKFVTYDKISQRIIDIPILNMDPSDITKSKLFLI